jgi:hypothetical protein
MRWIAAAVIGLAGLGTLDRGIAEEEALQGRFVVVEVVNPAYHSNQLFFAFENYHSPRMKHLREKYGLDAVVAGEADEWKRILLLRNWIHAHIRIENENPTRTRLETFALLDAALAGGAFECTHFSIVQHAVLNSFGYVTRRLGAGPGLKENGGHHGINEVWVNKLSKWVLVDSKYDLHFEKDSVPLSALEIRDEVWKDGGKSVVLRYGPERKTTTDDPAVEKEKPTAETYRWVSFETSTNRFTIYPATLSSTLVLLDDENFRNNVWYRGGKPAWFYNTPYALRTTQRDWIEWTPNVIASRVRVDGEKARVSLASFTPNFKTFQMRIGEGTWRNCEDELDVPLVKGTNRFVFRTVNLFEVTGPEHRVQIDWLNIAETGGGR